MSDTIESADAETLIGRPAPDFTLPADSGGEVSLRSLRGKTVVLYFYPKDDTSGCTQQSCDFRDALPRFAGIDAAVIGISKDSPASHDRFKAKYRLTFPLASDETGRACEDYGVWREKSMYGKKYMGIERSTFLIDGNGNGIVRAAWRKVKVPGHVEEVAKAAEGLGA